MIVARGWVEKKGEIEEFLIKGYKISGIQEEWVVLRSTAQFGNYRQ
jgi:hypothetical protein